MVVHVKAEHIKKGIWGSSQNCPVAIALKEQLHRAVHVNKSITIKNYYKGDSRVWKTPTRVLQFFNRFDIGERVKPFSFILK